MRTTINDLLAVVKSFAIVFLFLVIASSSIAFGAEDMYTTIANREIARLTIELDKAEKTGNAKKVRYILAQLKTQSKVITLGNEIKESK